MKITFNNENKIEIVLGNQNGVVINGPSVKEILNYIFQAETKLFQVEGMKCKKESRVREVINRWVNPHEHWICKTITINSCSLNLKL